MQPLTFQFNDKSWTLGKTPLLMGVLNVTPDSFSDGSHFLDQEKAVAHGQRMVDQGADIIDVGGESTRPGAPPVDPDVEHERVVPVIRQLAEAVSNPISIDTRKSQVAEAALKAGATIVNDVSALQHDPAMGGVIRDHSAGCILMHMRGTPETMQKNIAYEDVTREVKQFLQEAVNRAVSQGIDREHIVLDPGIGFGKRVEDNLKLINNVDAFRSLDRPVLMGPSRKSFIGKLSPGAEEPTERLWGTAAAITACILNGADILRVHDIPEMIQVIDVASALRDT